MTVPIAADEPMALAQQYGPLVFKAAFRVLGDASLAEDVQQEVFLRLLETRPIAVKSWTAFLTASATRHAIDVLRRQQRWWRLLPLWRAQEPIVAASAEEVGMAHEQAQRLRKALAALPRREAQCFGLRYLQGLGIDEIAQTLSMRENNVNVTLHRARRRLEAQLGEPAAEVSP